jgi:AcrR family transcriptional regulator
MIQNTENKEISRKEREKLARQQEMLKAARELFIKKGYHETTLDDIARQSEFGKGTIYNYFSSKEDLFFSIIDQLIDESVLMAQQAMQNTVGGAREKCLAYAETMLLHARDNADLFHLIIREFQGMHIDGPLKDRLKNIQQGTKRLWGLISEPIAAEIRSGKMKILDSMDLAVVFEGMVRFQCLRYFSPFERTDNQNARDTAALITSVFFDGISAQQTKG